MRCPGRKTDFDLALHRLSGSGYLRDIRVQAGAQQFMAFQRCSDGIEAR